MCSEGSSADTPQTRNSGAGSLFQLGETQESGSSVSCAWGPGRRGLSLCPAYSTCGQCGPHPPRGVTCGWEDGAGRGPEARALLQMHGVCWSLAQRSWGRRASGPLVLEEEGEVLCFLPWRFEVVPGLTNMSVGYWGHPRKSWGLPW